MRKAEFTKIAKNLLPQFPQLAAERWIIFVSPVQDILCGLSFGGSLDINTFYLHKFILPLYVPTERIHVTFGERLKINGNEGWRTDDSRLIENLTDVIHREIPFLDIASTLTGCLNYLKASVNNGRPRVNSHELEALTYTLIKGGDYSTALESLAELERMLEGNTVPWVVKQRNRAQLIAGKLLQSPETALAQLEIWKTETIGKLGLEKYCNRNGRAT